MLIQFIVENFKSFKKEACLSFSANKWKEHNEVLIPFGKEFLLPTVGIYGANSSGKSNLFKAFIISLYYIRNSFSFENKQSPLIVPFNLDFESKDKPTSFAYIFIANGKKYSYYFTLTNTEIIEEGLYVFNSQKPSLIFERTATNKYKFSSKCKGELETVSKITLENRLFLATLSSFNVDATSDAVLWFYEKIDLLDSNILKECFHKSLEKLKEEDYKKFMKNLLHRADINISDYRYELLNGTDPISKSIEKSYEVITTYEVEINGKKEKIDLNLLNDESKGTIKLFACAPFIKEALEKGKTLIIDDFENSLHPLLAKLLVTMFNNPELNPNRAQLIFFTHETFLLDLYEMRRDQFYFINKDFHSGESKLYPLDAYSIRKDRDIEKDYLFGRYEAVPFVNDW